MVVSSRRPRRYYDSDDVGCVVAMVSFPFILVLSSIMRGMVLSILWRWFVISTFGLGVPDISVAQAIGISLVVGMFTERSSRSRSDSSDDDDTSSWGVLIQIVVLTIGGPLLTLGLGWIVLQFI